MKNSSQTFIYLFLFFSPPTTLHCRYKWAAASSEPLHASQVYLSDNDQFVLLMSVPRTSLFIKFRIKLFRSRTIFRAFEYCKSDSGQAQINSRSRLSRVARRNNNAHSKLPSSLPSPSSSPSSSSPSSSSYSSHPADCNRRNIITRGALLRIKI